MAAVAMDVISSRAAVAPSAHVSQSRLSETRSSTTVRMTADWERRCARQLAKSRSARSVRTAACRASTTEGRPSQQASEPRHVAVEGSLDRALKPEVLSRRASLLLSAAACGTLLSDWCVLPEAQAAPFVLPPPGFRMYVDRFEGFSFLYPDSWLQVRGSGQACFFRSVVNLDENVSMELSSPSSSRYESVRDLGTPEQAGMRLEKQLLTEFMSTRLGVRREATFLSASSRSVPPPAASLRLPSGEPPKAAEYFEVELNVKSYANNNQLAIMPDERVQVLEWDRHYLTVLAVANRRLYQLRLQVPERLLAVERPLLRQIMDSFRVFEV